MRMRLEAITRLSRTWINLSRPPEMIFKVLVVLSLFGIGAALPGKLLRVPKIYNALITTKEKLLPSEAYPATTGPIFQPIPLTGEPILLNANDFINSANRQEGWRRSQEEDGNDPSGMEPSPVVFYPRYGVYYPHHTVVSYVNTLQHSFVFTAVDHSKGKSPPRTEIKRIGEGDYHESSYAKNNLPSKTGIPDVPPPPLPRGYINSEEETDKELR